MKESVKIELDKIEKQFNEKDYNAYINGEISSNQLSINYGVHVYHLYRYFKLHNYKTRGEILKSETNHYFFTNIDSEIKAYLLGFYLADGCLTISKSNTYRLSVSVTENDIEIINLFKKYIFPNYKITCRKSYTNKKTGYTSKPLVGITGNSNIIGEQLENYGIGCNKTYLGKSDFLNTIPKQLLIHFIRGYFDGDGTVYYGKTTTKKRNKTTNEIKCYESYNYNWSIISNLKDILIKIQKFLTEEYNIHSNILNDSRGHFLIEINRKKDFFRMRDILYENAEFYLSRKKEKYMTIPC